MKKIGMLIGLFLIMGSVDSLFAQEEVDIDRNKRVYALEINSGGVRNEAMNSPLVSSKKDTVKYNEPRFLSIGVFGSYASATLNQTLNSYNNNLIYDEWNKLNGSDFKYGLNIKIRIPVNEGLFQNFWLETGLMKGSLDYDIDLANNKQYDIGSSVEYIDHEMNYKFDYTDYYFGINYSIWSENYKWFAINPNIRFHLLNFDDVTIEETDMMEGNAVFTNGRREQKLISTSEGMSNVFHLTVGVDFEFRLAEQVSFVLGAEYSPGGVNAIEDESIADRTGMMNENVRISERELGTMIPIKFGVQYNF